MKTRNAYIGDGGIPASLFEKMPKAVLAAIAVSFSARLCERDPWDAFTISEIISEWEALNRAGIVPQAPPASLSIGGAR